MPTRITAANIDTGAITADKIAGSVALGGPKITGIVYPGDDTAALPAGGQTITINGSGFQSGCSVILEGAAVSVVTFVSATQLQITAPAKATGTYTLYVVNPDGGTAIRVPGMVYSGTPTWTTASGSLGTPYETASFSVNLAATGDGSLTYAVSAGSSLPTGLTLTSGGLLSGTVPATAADTTYTFNIDVIDSENQSTARQFSVTYQTDVITWSSPAAGASFSWDQNTANSTSLTAASAAGKAISFAVQSGSLPANVTITGNLISGTPTTVQANTAVTVRATANTTTRFADQILYFTVAEGSSSRGLIGSGFGISGSRTNSIEYINIASTGNSSNFGNLNFATNYLGSCASATRGIFAGGYADTGAPLNTINYVTIASAGNATNFGNLSVGNFSGAKYGISGLSNSTIGIFAGGRDQNNNYSTDMEYITIASGGNSASFGSIGYYNQRTYMASCADTTRGIFAGGFDSTYRSLIQYVTIASAGNATTFGDLITSRASFSGCSSATRGIFGGGSAPGTTDTIDYITIATTGNATFFGSLSIVRSGSASCSSKIRGIFAGGFESNTRNSIYYVTIATTGNASYFGDLTVFRSTSAACSNDHGGL